MGKIVLAAKCTHVPTMPMFGQGGPVKGKRQSDTGQTNIIFPIQ